MSEISLEEMRQLYAHWGIDQAASFLLDGTSFTRQRVEESYDGIHYPPEVYDAGVQILANAMDWLFIHPNHNFAPPPQTGSFSNPSLGLMMICFAFIGLFFFDAYLGFSYLASFVIHLIPNDLYEEAFWPLHRRWKLPILHGTGNLMQNFLWGTHISQQTQTLSYTGRT